MARAYFSLIKIVSIDLEYSRARSIYRTSASLLIYASLCNNFKLMTELAIAVINTCRHYAGCFVRVFARASDASRKCKKKKKYPRQRTRKYRLRRCAGEEDEAERAYIMPVPPLLYSSRDGRINYFCEFS